MGKKIEVPDEIDEGLYDWIAAIERVVNAQQKSMVELLLLVTELAAPELPGVTTAEAS